MRVPSNQRTAFSLIELLAVVAILAFAVGVVAIRVRGPFKNARRDTWLAASRNLDQVARARRNCVVWVDRRVGELSLRSDGARDKENQSIRQLRVPEPVFIGEVLGATSNQDGTHTIQIDRWGSSNSYAISVRSEDASERWLVVLGLTGQSYVFEDRASVVSILGMEGRKR